MTTIPTSCSRQASTVSSSMPAFSASVAHCTQCDPAANGIPNLGLSIRNLNMSASAGRAGMSTRISDALDAAVPVPISLRVCRRSFFMSGRGHYTVRNHLPLFRIGIVVRPPALRPAVGIFLRDRRRIVIVVGGVEFLHLPDQRLQPLFRGGFPIRLVDDRPDDGNRAFEVSLGLDRTGMSVWFHWADSRHVCLP